MAKKKQTKKRKKKKRAESYTWNSGDLARSMCESGGYITSVN